MDSLQKAEELIAQKKYRNAKEILKRSLNEPSGFDGDLYSLLLDLYAIETDNEIDDYLELGILQLESTKNYNLLERVCRLQIKTKSSTIKNEIMLMNCQWELGKVDVFMEMGKALNLKILENKYYNLYPGFLEAVEQRTKNVLYIYLGKINFYCLSGQFINAIGVMKQIDENWNNIQKNSKSKLNKDAVYQRIHDSIAPYIEYKPELYLEYLYYKSFLGRRKNDKLSIKEAIEICLLGSTNTKYLIEILYLDIPDKTKYLLISYIKKQKNYSYQFVKNEHSELKKMFLTNIFTGKKSLEIIDNEVPDISEYVDSINDIPTDYIRNVSLITEISKEENEFIIRILAKDTDIFENHERWIVVLIELSFYRACIKLIESLNKSIENLYLLSHCYFQLSEFLECIESANEGITQCSEEEAKSFLYMKAESYQRMGKEEEAYNYYKKVYLIDSSYRDIKEKIKLCRK